MANITVVEASRRFSVVADSLAAAPAAAAVSVGFAELTPDETAMQLIARVDGELTDRRRNNHDSRPGPGDNTSASQAC